MMVFVLIVSLLVGTVLAEIAFRTFGGHWLHDQLIEIKKLLQTFRNAEGDDNRQRLLLCSGRATLQISLRALGVIVMLATVVSLAPWAMQWTESQQLTYIVASSMIASAWWALRRSRLNITTPATPQTLSAPSTVRANAYSLLDRWLHWLALEPVVVRQLAFDLERQFALPKHPASATSPQNKAADGAVYVCGLARSGTTMLLRILGDNNTFRSLAYRDMPFVLAPNLWKQITRHFRQKPSPSERAHGDGILVDFDSPEGFEEVFWRTFGTSTTDPLCFGADEPSPEVLAAFADYRALVANPRTEPRPANGIQRRYLSKNNNNLLRLRSLCADPTAAVLVVYRNPVATASSLHRQHQRFCAAQTEDRFTRNYMGWLAHHEFGLDHRPFCFAVPEMEFSYTPDDPNYWLEYWIAVYRQVLAQHDLPLHLIHHDAFRSEPVKTLDAIFAALGVQADTETLSKQIAAPTPDTAHTDGFSPELLRRAEATYRALLASPKNLPRPTDLVNPE